MDGNNIKSKSFLPPLGLAVCTYIVMGLVLYYRTLNTNFIYDDLLNIDLNPYVQRLAFMREIWRINQTRFLAYWSLAWNYRLGGTNPLGYHIFNILVHMAVSVLVYIFSTAVLRTPKLRPIFTDQQVSRIAFAGGLIFLCHPIQTQAVSYIVQRITSLSTFFYLVSIIFYINFRLQHKIVSFILSLIMTVAAMVTKEVAFTLPFSILLIESLFFDEDSQATGRRWRYVIPYLLTLPLIPLLLFFGVHSGRALGSMTSETLTISRMDYFSTQIRVLVTYLRLLVWPFNQNLDYDYPLISSLFKVSVICSGLLLISMILLAIWQRKRNRILAFCIFWFFLTLSVESSFFPINDVIQEHRLYLPMIAFAFGTAVFLNLILRKQWLYRLVLTLIIAYLSILTFQRNEVWQTPLRVWQDTAAKSPNKLRVLNNLAGEYIVQQRYEEALPLLAKAIEMDPEYAKAYFNLATIYKAKGDLDQALHLALQAYQYDTKDHRNAQLVGYLYLQMDDYQKALAYYQKFLILRPSFKNAKEYVKILIFVMGETRNIQLVRSYSKTLLEVGYQDIYEAIWDNSLDK